MGDAHMAKYFFDLIDGDCGYIDPDGVEFAHDQSATDYACRVAAELVRNRERETMHWRIDVRNACGTTIFQFPFSLSTGAWRMSRTWH
jgi:hypothetical protein